MNNTATMIAVAVTILAQVTQAGEAGSPKTSSSKRTSGSTWEQVSGTVRTPQEASRRVRRQVEYKEDLGDEWATGKETWNRGYGDCEDFAFAVADLCKDSGIDTSARVVVFIPEKSFDGHAVAIGTREGGMWVSSNGSYQTAKDMQEVARIVARQMGWHRKILRSEYLDRTAKLESPVKVGKP